MLISDPTEKAEWRKFADRIEAVGPYALTLTTGVTAADNIAAVLFAHRDAATLAWSPTPIIALPPPAQAPGVPVDVPPWWRMKKKNIGSSFDSWLREEGIYEEVTATAIKRVLSRQLEAAMEEKGLSKSEMARRMHTSRAALDRLLDPQNGAVTLSTLQKAAAVVGREIRLELV